MRKISFDSDMPIGKIILIVWIVFASLYVVYGEYQRLQRVVANTSYNRGLSTAVNQLISESAKCQPIPVKAGDVQVDLIAIKCLQGGDNQEAPAEGE